MWTYDGEEWRQDDDDNIGSSKPKVTPVRVDELVPELQIIEIVQIPRTYVPPFPLP